MELKDEFRVGLPVEAAWRILTDVELIAPCMPGAQLTEVDGDTYKGQVKVKVGPITAQYKGAATFLEKDDENHRAVLEGTGRDTRGQGNASAVVNVEMHPEGDATQVTLLTELKVTGKVAQFGRGVMADVSSKLLAQFVECLEGKVLATEHEGEEEPADETASTETTPAPEPAPAPAAAAPSGPRQIDSPDVEPVDLLQEAGAPVAKRIVPLAVVVVILLFLLRRRRS